MHSQRNLQRHGAGLSDADSVADDLRSIEGVKIAALFRQTERGNRADDKRSETAMEDRKKEGYF